MSGPGDLSKVNTTSGEMFKRKTRGESKFCHSKYFYYDYDDFSNMT